MTALMYDSVNAAALPTSGATATAGYVNGLYANSARMQARFPNLPHVTITVFASGDAKVLDVENGDASPAQCPGWLDRQYSLGEPLPVLYGNTSVIAAIHAAVGSRPFLWWSAHYTYSAHLCGPATCGCPYQADATQFADHGPNGENVDQTLLSDRFLSVISGQPIPAPQEDDMFSDADRAMLTQVTHEFDTKIPTKEGGDEPVWVAIKECREQSATASISAQYAQKSADAASVKGDKIIAALADLTAAVHALAPKA